MKETTRVLNMLQTALDTIGQISTLQPIEGIEEGLLLEIGPLPFISVNETSQDKSYTLDMFFLSDYDTAALHPPPIETLQFIADMPIQLEQKYIREIAIMVNACNQTISHGCFSLTHDRTLVYRYEFKTSHYDISPIAWKEAYDSSRFFIERIGGWIEEVALGNLKAKEALPMVERALLHPRTAPDKYPE